jgi:hypothetical protein
MTRVVVEVNGGVVQEVYCNDARIQVVLVDWDELQSPESGGKAGKKWSRCAPLRELPDDTRAQVQQALAQTRWKSRGQVST